MYRTWEKGLTTSEEYKNVIRKCKDAMRKTKASLELNLARNVKDKKKGLSTLEATRRPEKMWACC